MKSIKFLLNRYKAVIKRQSPPKFGRDYEPSILATTSEASSFSGASRIRSVRLGREIHALSEPERSAILLALYHPSLFDLQEQRMLSTLPTNHPLHGHPRAIGMVCPPLAGTIAVADRLGMLDLHSVLWVDGNPAAIPWIGDLLLFLEDDNGPYCVNWTVKDKLKSFEVPFQGKPTSRSPEKDAAKALGRHAIEEAYYRDGTVPTIRVAEEAIDRVLINNLRRLFNWSDRPISLPESDRIEIIERLRAGIFMNARPLDILLGLHRRIPCDLQEKKAVMYQAILSRELRVDLYSSIATDIPLRPEQRDVLQEHAAWFSREVK